jgi:carbon-monoxide dehydrogenase medium subunit
MKPAPFEYVAVRTAAEAVRALAGPGEARVLAGGQSLVPELNFRTVRPGRLVDINRVAGFAGLEADPTSGVLRVRPLARHRAFERPAPGSGALGELLAAAARHIAHPPVRARGTMLGSLAYAHPAAEWPAVAVALAAEFDLTGPAGIRSVPAGQFFTGPFRTARRPDELLTEARLPLLPAGTGVGFAELRRTRASFAQLAVAAAVIVRDGTVRRAWLGLANAADRPVRALAAERALAGQPATAVSYAAAGAEAAGSDADPRPQPYTDLAYQRHAIAVLVVRALMQASSPEPEPEPGR